MEQTAANRDGGSQFASLSQAQPYQQGQRDPGTDTAPQHHAQAGTLHILPGPEGQGGQGDGHGAQLLGHLHGGQRSDSVGGGKISAHHPAEAHRREKNRKQPQGRDGQGISNPPPGQQGRTEKQRRRHGTAGQNAIQKAGGENAPHILGLPLAQLLCRQVHGCGADSCNACHHGQIPQGQHQL